MSWQMAMPVSGGGIILLNFPILPERAAASATELNLTRYRASRSAPGQGGQDRHGGCGWGGMCGMWRAEGERSWTQWPPGHSPLSFRALSSMVMCSASSDSDSSGAWLPRSVSARRRLNFFIFSIELRGRGGLRGGAHTREGERGGYRS